MTTGSGQGVCVQVRVQSARGVWRSVDSLHEGGHATVGKRHTAEGTPLAGEQLLEATLSTQSDGRPREEHMANEISDQWIPAQVAGETKLDPCLWGLALHWPGCAVALCLFIGSAWRL